MDALNEITPENPVPRVAPSSDETPPPPQTTQEQKNETTIPNAGFTMQSAASNHVNNDEYEIEILTMNNKRTFNEDSSEEDTNNPLSMKKGATSSPASEQSGTRVPKGRGGGDLPKISAFPASTPKPGGRGSSQGDKSPARGPRFSTNTGEDSSEEDTNNPLSVKKDATSSPASEQSGTCVPKEGEGEIYLRSLPSLPALLKLEDRGPVREISLPHGVPISQQTQVRNPRVLAKVVEITVK